MNGKIEYSKYRTGEHDSAKILRSLFYKDGQKGYLWNKLWKMNIIKSSNLNLVNDISMAEDLLFTVEYLHNSKKIYVSNCPTYVYMITKNSLSSQIRLDSFDSHFIKTNTDFLYVCERILSFIPKKNKETLIDGHAFLARTASNFLRQLRLYDKNKNLKMQKHVKKICSENKSSVIKTKTMTQKNKIGYFLTLYFPNFVLLLDRIRFKK